MQINSIDETTMTRKEFLTLLGGSVSLFVINWFIGDLNQPKKSLSVKSINKNSYGNSAYGGKNNEV